MPREPSSSRTFPPSQWRQPSKTDRRSLSSGQRTFDEDARTICTTGNGKQILGCALDPPFASLTIQGFSNGRHRRWALCPDLHGFKRGSVSKNQIPAPSSLGCDLAVVRHFVSYAIYRYLQLSQRRIEGKVKGALRKSFLTAPSELVFCVSDLAARASPFSSACNLSHAL